MSSAPVYIAPHAPMLLEVVRERIRSKHYSRGTEKSYTNRISRYVHVHHMQRPRKIVEVERGCTAIERKLPAYLDIRRDPE